MARLLYQFWRSVYGIKLLYNLVHLCPMSVVWTTLCGLEATSNRIGVGGRALCPEVQHRRTVLLGTKANEYLLAPPANFFIGACVLCSVLSCMMSMFCVRDWAVLAFVAPPLVFRTSQHANLPAAGASWDTLSLQLNH